ncbi:MAG: SDR family oxidoreductase, partial [Chthoniobacterales bacterium]
MPLLRVAAAGDIHVDRHNRDEVAQSFAALNGQADVVLIAGDMTTHGEPGQSGLGGQPGSIGSPGTSAGAGGSIVGFTSAAFVGSTSQANYASAKGGIISLTRSAALSLHRYGVRANCI